MNWRDFVHSDAKILLGKPVFRGTRISVELVLEELASGASVEEVLEAHPTISREHGRAGLAYAADSIKGDEMVLLGPETAQ